MSESERRRKYRYNRVLIETERILDPQFDDAVIYLTGAQIELLRNVTQYLNRLDTYVTEYASGYYLAPTAADYDSILAIVADLEETLMGNPNTIWGFFGQVMERRVTVSTGEDDTYVETVPVPAGYVHVIEHISLYHTAGQTCGVNMVMNVGGSDPILYNAPALPSAEKVYQYTNLTLVEDNTIRLEVSGLPDTKICVLRCAGYSMKVP